ncbi:hypothetical protein [Haloprofundus sp. MHR1]|uniref:hypothetical protein n=1 Tax=Haloprofundus sp. MHR1 TaxID=2572921 RepID=UPI0010BF2244|nr:hypothetical protein [Haloprofundus sp. MHR1]QCJ45890.1 hypothetical protein FCF25_01595 [Haloprofundus sp. MHR1]
MSVAHPSNKSDHGLNETTYCTLWAGDEDVSNVSAFEDLSNESSAELCTLAAGTDIPLDTPPEAVEQWNRGDLQDFPQTDATQSIHPPNATLSNGRFVKDAYTEIFAVQPSTRARLSPSDQPLYVASNGTLLGTVDYRVAVPANTTHGDRRTNWEVVDHEIVETRLLVNGEVESTTSGTHTPELPYSLASQTDELHSLTLVAEIAVTVERRVSVCTARDARGACLEWDIQRERRTETQVVRDSIDVVAYDLTISGYRAVYPNGDLGLVVYKNQPWLGYSLPNGDVRGVWRFYSARDPEWDTLVTSTDEGQTVEHSSLHPLQVNAFPIETGPTPSPRRTVTILETYGIETQPPTVPKTVLLDTIDEPYTASYGIATRTTTTEHNLTSVTAYGLVRGVEVDASESSFATVPINESELTLEVLNTTEDSVTVRVRLRDAQTGEPINTLSREGYVVLEDQRVNTSNNGTVTTTLSHSAGGVSARYEPGHWWRSVPGYVGDSDVVYVRGPMQSMLSVLYEVAVSVSLFLLGVFFIDRITGWHVWPPWRRL